VLVQGMMANRYMATFRDAILGWNKKLMAVADVVQVGDASDMQSGMGVISVLGCCGICSGLMLLGTNLRQGRRWHRRCVLKALKCLATLHAPLPNRDPSCLLKSSGRGLTLSPSSLAARRETSASCLRRRRGSRASTLTSGPC
jgi:hypothetical protein